MQGSNNNNQTGNLTLTRKPGESIHIGDDITVEIVRVQGDRVRLVVTAPRAINIRRSELPVPVVEMGQSDKTESRIAHAYPCHSCGVEGCEDKRCCG